MATEQKPRFLTPEEASRRLTEAGLPASRSTVRRLMDEGLLPYVTLNTATSRAWRRIPADAVDRLIGTGLVTPSPQPQAA